MNEDDKKKPDDNAAGEAEPSSGDRDPPEVEAEIVRPEDVPGEKAFDENADKAGDDFPKGDQGETERPEPAPKSGGVTPGLFAFFALALIAIAAIAYWYFAVREPATDAGAPPREERAQTEPGDDAAPVAPEPDAMASGPKIDNAIADMAQKPGQAVPSQPPSPTQSATPLPASETGSAIDNAALRDDAKRALSDTDGESEPQPEDDSDISLASEDDAFAFTFDAEDGPLDSRDEAAASLNDDEQSDADPSAEELADTLEAEEATPMVAAPEAVAANAEKAGIDEDLRDEDSVDQASTDEAMPEEKTVEEAPEADPALLQEAQELAAKRELALEQDLEAAQDALESLESDVAALERDLSDERGRAGDLEAQLREARRATDAAIARADAAEARASQINTRLARLQQKAARAPADAAALTAINRALDQGEPFAEPLASLRRSQGDLAPLDALAPYAEEGAPSLDAVRRRFDEAIREGLAEAGRAQAEGPVERLAAQAASLISIRPAAPREGDTPRAVVSRAERALEQGRIREAIDEMRALPEPAQAAMADWIDYAAERARIVEAQQQLNATLLDGEAP